MATTRTPDENDVAEAINRVLESERDAARAIAAAQVQAQAALAEARERRRDILERARRRVLRLHGVAQATLRAKLQALETQAAQQSAVTSGDFDTAAAAAVARLAERLTTDEPAS